MSEFDELDGHRIVVVDAARVVSAQAAREVFSDVSHIARLLRSFLAAQFQVTPGFVHEHRAWSTI
jgi:hypothetical protein